jgi:putative ABC transport system permease protein
MIRHLFKLAWNRKRSNGLVILEIAASFLVVFAVVAFGLYLAGNWRVPLGFTYQDVWNVSIDFGRSDVGNDSTEEKEVFRRLLEEARTIDGVVAVAGASGVPYDNSQSIGNWLLEGREIEIGFVEVTDGLQDVLGLELARGRWFEAADSALAWEPVVIDEGMSRALYDDGDAVGKKLPLNDENAPGLGIGVVRPFRRTESPIQNIPPADRAGRLEIVEKPRSCAPVDARSSKRWPSASTRSRRNGRSRSARSTRCANPL